MNTLFGVLLAAFGGMFVILNGRFSQGSVANQEKISGPLDKQSRSRIASRSRVKFMVIGTIMVAIGLGVAVGIFT